MSKTLLLQRKRRIRKCYEHLRKIGRVDSLSDISRGMSVPSVSVRVAFSLASNYLSPSFILSFVQAYDNLFSADWILSGEGTMLTKTERNIDKELRHRWQRVAYIVRQEGGDYRDFSSRIGFDSPSVIYRTLFQHTRPQDKTLIKILDAFPQYSSEWLFSGRGPIRVQVEKEQGESRFAPEVLDDQRGNATPYVDYDKMTFRVMTQDAVAGRLLGYDDETYAQMETKEIPVDRYYHGEYALFRVKGDSMDNGSIRALADGDVVLARSIPRDYWRYKLHTHDWLYFIFLTQTEGVIIKSIAHHDTEKGVFVLRSLNPLYKDIHLDVRDVCAIYNVIEVTRRSLKA